MPKRANHEGSVYKRTSDGRWVASLSVPGSAKRKHFFGASQEAVLNKLTEARKQQKDGVPFSDDRLITRHWLKAWVNNQKPPATKPKTYIAYENQVRLHLDPALGSKVLSKLTPQDVRDLMREKLDSGLSVKTVRHLRATLRAALNAAQTDGLVNRNVAALAKPPKLEKRKLQVLSEDQARLLLSHADGHRLEGLVTVALSLALREGETLGLQLDDIDWVRGRIHIQRQLQRVYRIGAKDEGPKTELQLSSLKTDQSHRILELPEVTLKALRKHLECRENEKLLCGSAWQETGFLFTSRIGTALEPRNVTRDFRALLKSANLPPMRFHDLRHSAVALLIAQGAHAKAIMALLGHSTITLTMDTYGHLLEVVNRDTAAKMNTALNPVAVTVAVKPKLKRVK